MPPPLKPAASGPELGAVVDWVLLAAALVLLAIPHRELVSGDAVVRYQSLLHFVQTGVGTNMQYQFVGPFFSTPLYFADRLLGTGDQLLFRYNLLLFGGLLAVLWLALRSTVDPAVLRLFLLLLAAGSLFGAATMDYLGEMFTASLVAAGIALVLSRRGTGWALVVLGAANTPAAVPAVGLSVLRRVWETRRLRPLLAMVAIVALVAVDTWVRRHQLLVTGYATSDHALGSGILPYSGRPGFSYPLLFGILSILFSFGKGLLFFAPGLALGARSQILAAGGAALWRLHSHWLTITAGLVLVYGAWWAWYGGFTWGPRFFLLASVPASLALAAVLRRPPRSWALRALVAAVAVLSAWVGVDGVVFGQANLEACIANNFALEHLCWYVPEYSPLWHPFVQPRGSFSLTDDLFLVLFAVLSVRLVWPLMEGIDGALLNAWNAIRETVIALRP